MTFADKFCAQNRVPPEEFVEAVLRLALRPKARAVRWLLALIPDYFAADRELIISVGRLQRLEAFDAEVMDFMYDPNNRGFLRRAMNLRVSTRRLYSLMRTTLRDQVPSAATADEAPRASDDHETAR